MSGPAKYRPGAYIPRILALLADTPVALTRKQIAAALKTSPESIATAMLELTQTGQVAKLPHTTGVAATYRLPHIRVHKCETRTWHTTAPFAWSPRFPITMPAYPWEEAE